MVTVLDSFEDGDLSEWSGQTSRFTVTQDSSFAYDGSYYLDGNNDNFPGRIYRNNTTVGYSDTPFALWIKPDSYGRERPTDTEGGLLFGRQESQDYYVLRYDLQSGNLFLIETRYSNQLDSVGYYATNGNWYQLVVTDWQSGGNIDAEMRDSSGTTVASVTGNDTTHGSGGIGVESHVVSSSMKADYLTWNPVAPPSTPQNVTVNQI